MTSPSPYAIGDLQAQPGSQVRGHCVVDLGASTVALPIAVTQGTGPGPVLAVTAGIHGGEYVPMVAVRQFIRDLDPARMRGTVVACVQASPAAFEQRSAFVNPLDGQNLNRSFPGDPLGGPTARLAAWLWENLLSRADYYVDCHCGDLPEVLAWAAWPRPRATCWHPSPARCPAPDRERGISPMAATRAITWNIGGAVPPRHCRGGRMSADPPSSPVLRASDADRDRVIEVLRAAVADGRLDPAEFDERLDAALVARTIDALAPLTADLVAASGGGGAVTLPLAEAPPVELLTINEKHGSVRRDGRWRLPHRLALRTAWCDVMLDLTKAVRSGPELIIEMRVRGGDVELVLAPGMVVDANELSVRHTRLAISRDAGDDTPETLCVRLTGRMKHGRINTRWLAPRR